tara:strand:+ start:363 stop:788 length:426 start_codon:yes stop_codon:yes gene_type:complete
MSNSSINAIQLIRRKLLSNVSIQNEVSGRVYTSHFLDLDNQTTKMPLIILDNQGGSGNYSMSVQILSVHVYVYSNLSSSQASDIYNMVYETLHAERLADDTASAGISQKGIVFERERPKSGFNQSIKGWFQRATYTVQTAG